MDINSTIKMYTNDEDFYGYSLQDDGDGAYIKTWDHPTLAKPSMETLMTFDSACNLCCAKKAKMVENETNYEAKRQGFQVINGIPINIDPISCGNISGQVLLIVVNKFSQGAPLAITWFDDVNIGTQYTEEEFMALGQTVAYTIFIIQQKLSANKLAIQSATTLEELELVDTNYNL